MDETLTPLQRLFLAFVAFFAVLFNRRFAEEVHALRARERAALPPGAAAPKPPDHAESLQIIALLQRDGRLLDFLEESLEGFSDSEIGAAARTVHAGCKKALGAYLQLEPVLHEPEGASVTIASGFDPAAVRLTGNVVGQPPFKGALRHHGWRAARTSFPPLPAHDPRILAPAEVEL